MHNPNRQQAVEHIQADESLTSDLIDTAVHFLTRWALTQIDLILKEETREEVIGQRVGQLRRKMRRISRLAGQVPPEEQLRQVKDLLLTMPEETPTEPPPQDLEI